MGFDPHETRRFPKNDDESSIKMPRWPEFSLGSRTIIASEVEKIVHQVYRMKLERPSVLELDPDSPERQELFRIDGDVFKSEASLEAAKASMPEWFLPPVVIVKRMRTTHDREYNDSDEESDSNSDEESDSDSNDDLFAEEEPSDAKRDADYKQRYEREKEAYERLKPVQDIAVPLCYGEGFYKDQPALVFHHYDGVTIDSSYHLEEDIPNLKELITEPFQIITKFGIIHKDAAVHNVLLVVCGNGQRRAMLLDFEYSEFRDDINWEKSEAKRDVGFCYNKYKYWRGMVLEQRRQERMTPAEKRAEQERRDEAARYNIEEAYEMYGYPAIDTTPQSITAQ